MNEETVFHLAREKPPHERAAFLEAACAGDAEMRQRVEVLLEADDSVGSFLQTPVNEQLATSAFRPEGGQEPSSSTHCLDGATPEVKAEPTMAETAPPKPEGLGFLAPGTRPGSIGRLGHYEILEVIGKGGFGTVLKAFDDKLHRIVAIKVLSPAYADNGSARKRFIREAHTAAAVKNEHVVAIYDVEKDSQPPYLAMEMIEGVSLQDKIDTQGPLGIREILRIGMQMAEGLAAAHKQGLVHRDIKPANILLENGVERVKITDFGLARAVDDASVTQSGTVAGTPMYMSPEQAEGVQIDHRSDLFSLGTVLYAMCTGHPPFRASGTHAVLKRVIDASPRPIREINSEIPDWLCGIIAKLHAKKPEERFQTATEVAELLGQRLADVQVGRAVQGEPSRVRAELPPPATKQDSVPFKTKIAGCVIAFVGIALVGIAFQLPPKPAGLLFAMAGAALGIVSLTILVLALVGAGRWVKLTIMLLVGLPAGVPGVLVLVTGNPYALPTILAVYGVAPLVVYLALRSLGWRRHAAMLSFIFVLLVAAGFTFSELTGLSRFFYAPSYPVAISSDDPGTHLRIWSMAQDRPPVNLEGDLKILGQPAYALENLSTAELDLPVGNYLLVAELNGQEGDRQFIRVRHNYFSTAHHLPNADWRAGSFIGTGLGDRINGGGHRSVTITAAANLRKLQEEKLQALRGKWVILSGEANGEALPKEFLSAVSIVFDDAFELKISDFFESRSSFAVDANAAPRTITTSLIKSKATGNGEGKVQQTAAELMRRYTLDTGFKGIYQLEGDRLKLSIAQNSHADGTAKVGPLNLILVREEPGWVQLFNGKDHSGWVVQAEPNAVRPERAWEIFNNVLIARGRPEGCLRTEKAYHRYILEMECQASLPDPGWAGDLLFHIPVPDAGLGRTSGMRLRIEPGRHGSFAPLGGVAPFALRPVDWRTFKPDWNHLRFESTAGRFEVLLNGKSVLKLTEFAGGFPPGYFGIMSAGGNGMRYRNIRIKELPPEEPGWVQLFNGKDLTGWKEARKTDAKWSVEDGVLVGRAGDVEKSPSILLSDRSDYRNFHFRIEAMTDADNDDGGQCFRYLFRAGNWKGYEAQIQHMGKWEKTGSLWWSDTPAKSAAITQVDRVNIRGGEWFTQEVIAQGSRIKAILNGKVMSEINDPTYDIGHLALLTQAGTVRFRKIEVKELPAGDKPPLTTKAIDLMPLARPDPQAGTWKREGDTLVSIPPPAKNNAVFYSKLPIHTELPREFVLEAVIERFAGADTIGFSIPAFGTDFLVSLDGYPAKGFCSGLSFIGGKSYTDNETTVRGRQLVNGKKHTVRITVRAAGVAADLDGKALFDYRGGYDKIEPNKRPDAGGSKFFVQIIDSPYRIHALRLIPLAGDVKAKTLPQEPGWVQLFNGKDLSGWTSKNSPFGTWKIEQGELIGQGNQARLRTERENLSDFHLRVEAKYTGHAHLVIREQADTVGKGYTIFMGSKPAGFRTGALTTYFGKKAGPLNPQEKELTKVDEWFTLEVIAKGNRLQVFVNGQRTADAEDANKNFMEGFISFRMTSTDGELHVRKVEIKELPPSTP